MLASESVQRADGISVKALILLFVVCFFARASWVIYRVQGHPYAALLPDSRSYIEPAQAMLQDHRFSTGPGLHQPEFFRTPGYPLFLASLFAIFGENLLAVCIVQALLSAGTVVLIYFIGARLWSFQIGWIAALLVLLEPLQMIYAATILTETIHALLLVLIALTGFFILQEERVKTLKYFWLGIATAAAILVRPGTYYFPVVILLLLCLNFLKGKTGWKSATFAMIAFGIPMILLVGGWKLRNHYAVDSWRLTNVDSRSLYFARATGVVASVEGISFDEARVLLHKNLGPRLKNESEGHFFERMRAEGLKIIRKHPDKLLPMTIKGLINFLGGSGYILDWLQVNQNVFTFRTAQSILFLFYLCVVAGIVFSFWKGEKLCHAFLFSIPLYIALVSVTNPLSFVRYRAPIMPILCLYAGAGANYIYHRWKNRKRVKAAGA